MPTGADQSATVPKLLTVFQTCIAVWGVVRRPRRPFSDLRVDMASAVSEGGATTTHGGLTSAMGAGMMPLVLVSTWDKGGKECCVSISACLF